MPEQRRLVDICIDESGDEISIVLDGQSEWVRAGLQFIPNHWALSLDNDDGGHDGGRRTWRRT